MKTMTPKDAAKLLNDQHMRTSAGFYTPIGRRFGARVHMSVLQFKDWGPDGKDAWESAPCDGLVRDHNGRELIDLATIRQPE